jgi:AraC-like DNA-binding protein
MSGEARYVYSRPADLPGVELLGAENNNRLFKVYHTTYAVCTMLNIDGYTEWRYRGRSVVSRPYHVALMEPGETHENTHTVGRWPFDVLFMSVELMNDVATGAGLGSMPHLSLATSHHPELVRAFAAFHDATRDQASLLARESRLMHALTTLLRCAAERAPRPEPSPGRRRLLAARDYLMEHWNDDVGLARVAGIAGLSRYHFLRAFRREFGISPHQLQIAVRIEKARDLLRAGVPVHAIEAGFADQSHFIRWFRHRMGATPREYQNMVAK